MSTTVTIVGGGSTQWVPTLVDDFANTPCLEELRLVLHDVDGARLARLRAYAERVRDIRALPWTVVGTTDRAEALAGADYVVVCISTGGLASMRHDLEVPARHGVVMPIGDTVGPSGISRALRNIPVLVDLARDMERLCPDAWMVNVTNPMTTLCRAVTRETSIRTVGLCHEVIAFSFWLSQLLDVPDMRTIRVEVAGVNHLPVVTDLTAPGVDDGLAQLHDVLDGKGVEDPLPFLDQIAGPESATGPGTGDGIRHPHGGGRWTKQTVIDVNRPNFELFARFGALPAAAADHVAEFFPNFLTERSGWGDRWYVDRVTVETREGREARYVAELERRMASDEVTRWRSMEMVAPVIESLVSGEHHELPLNIPNAGHVPDVPDEAVVEAICVTDGDGIRGRDRVELPPFFAEHVRRVSASQELTVDAALSGDREAVLAAMLADPIAGRSDWDVVEAMTEDLLSATAEWLPQFSGE